MKIAVIGGGLSGLAAAYQTQLQGAETVVYEASERFGGAIRTSQQDGFLLEGGADSILNEKPWARELAVELGLADQIVETVPENRFTYIVRSGQLLPVPEGFRLLAPQRLRPFLRSPLLSLGGRLRVAMEMVIPRRKKTSDESLASFVRRRLGKECLDRLAQPMAAGIYTADAEELSMQATMPAFLELEQRYGSVVRGLRARREPVAQGPRYSLFFNFKGGTQTLLDALAARLRNLRMNCPVGELRRADPGWTVDGEPYDAVVLALPAPQAARLLQPVDLAASSLLGGIEYLSSATVNLIYSEDVLSKHVGYGFVVPAIEGLSTLACTYSHLKWPQRAPAGAALLRGYVGGALDPDIVELEDNELSWHVRRDLQKLLGISARPLHTVVQRHRKAMPCYRVGHLQRVEEIEGRLAQLPGLELAGNALTGVGIPDVVRRAREVARRLA